MAGRSNLLAVSGEFALVERTDPSTTSMPTEGEYKYACFFNTIERERETERERERIMKQPRPGVDFPSRSEKSNFLWKCIGIENRQDSRADEGEKKKAS
jgi:hypothetical protein